MNTSLKKIVLTGLMTSLVFLATSVIKIPSTNGYIHLGDGFIFLSVIVLGPYYGAFASGVGSMMADLLSPYAQWALPTFIVKALMALIMGIVCRTNTKKQILLSSGTTFLVWAGFFIMAKNVLSRALAHSAENLAAALEDSPENVILRAVGVQWKMTAAIVGFFLLIFALLYWFSKKQKKTGFGPGIILGMMSGGACMVIGYYTAETILYGNPISPVFSIPMNLIQLITGMVITMAITPALNKAMGRNGEWLQAL